jgi:hypothetical protein
MADTASEPEDPETGASSKAGAASRDGAGSKAGASPRDGVRSKAAGSPADGASPEDEARRKFREALERKRAREADTSQARGGRDTGKIHGAHGPARQRRSFRRKSG